MKGGKERGRERGRERVNVSTTIRSSHFLAAFGQSSSLRECWRGKSWTTLRVPAASCSDYSSPGAYPLWRALRGLIYSSHRTGPQSQHSNRKTRQKGTVVQGVESEQHEATDLHLTQPCHVIRQVASRRLLFRKQIHLKQKSWPLFTAKTRKYFSTCGSFWQEFVESKLGHHHSLLPSTSSVSAFVSDLSAWWNYLPKPLPDFVLFRPRPDQPACSIPKCVGAQGSNKPILSSIQKMLTVYCKITEDWRGKNQKKLHLW